MPQDGSLHEMTKTNGAGRRHQKDVDPTKELIWDSIECMDQFRDLVVSPPPHSVVVHIDPIVAKAILKIANDRNRPLSTASVDNLVAAHEEGDFALTGDTIKFSRKGRLLDGQYRLNACVRANKGFQTHIVFGLDEKVFDILDRQRTRTPGDILAICNVRNPILVAGAVRWVLQLEQQRRGPTGRGMTPRHIRELATGPMRDLVHYAQAAEQIPGCL